MNITLPRGETVSRIHFYCVTRAHSLREQRDFAFLDVILNQRTSLFTNFDFSIFRPQTDFTRCTNHSAHDTLLGAPININCFYLVHHRMTTKNISKLQNFLQNQIRLCSYISGHLSPSGRLVERPDRNKRCRWLYPDFKQPAICVK